MCYAFHYRSRARCNGGDNEVSAHSAAGLAFYVAGSGDTVCAGVRG